METESSLRNVFLNKNGSVLDKNRTVDNVQKHNICIKRTILIKTTMHLNIYHHQWNACWKFKGKIWQLPSLATVPTDNPFHYILLHITATNEYSEILISLNMHTELV
jgi:hypothetical protein